MDIQTLIDKWKLSQTILSDKLKISTGAFSLKLRKKHDQDFSLKQEAKINESLKELHKDLGEYLSKFE